MADGKRKLLIEILSDFVGRKGFNDAETSVKGLGKEIGGLPLVAAATAVVGFGLKSVASFQAQSQEVLHFKQVSGLAAEEASRFVAVADDYGISADEMSAAIGKLNKTVGATPETLRKVGVEIANNAQGNYDAEKTFLNVVDAYNATNDAAQKAAIGAAAFGKGWQGVVKILDAGSGQIRSDFEAVKDFQLFDDADLKKSEEWRLALDDLSDTFKGFQRTVGEALVPALKWGLEKVKEFSEGIQEASKSLGGFNVGLAALIPLAVAHPFVAAGVGIVALGKYLEDATKGTGRLKEEFVGTTQAIHDQALAAQNASDVIANNATKYILQEAAKAEADKQAAAERKRIDAEYASNDGYRRSLDAQRDAAEKATKALQDYRTATNDLRNDQLGLEGSIYSALDAIDAYTAKVTDSTATLRDQQKANLDVKKSLEDVMQQALDAALSQAALHGATLTANGAIDAQLSALQKLYTDGMLPELRKEIDLYALALYNIPGQVHTDVDFSGTDPITGRAIGGTRREGTGAGGSAASGADIVSQIKQYESSNGTAWRQ